MTNPKTRKLGILGGLGPLSSAYFYEMIINHTYAEKDQDHIDMVLSSRSSTPDRTDFIMGRSSANPLGYMTEDAVMLEKCGVDAIVIPCNTAHYFIDEVRKAVSVEVPSIVTETAKHIKKAGHRSACVFATEGTVKSEEYQTELDKFGIRCVIPDSSLQEKITDIIYNKVKKGTIPPKETMYEIADPIFDSGCDCIILGCTELSLLKQNFRDDKRFVDSMEALAYRVITMYGKKPVGFSSDYDNI